MQEPDDLSKTILSSTFLIKIRFFRGIATWAIFIKCLLVEGDA